MAKKTAAPAALKTDERTNAAAEAAAAEAAAAEAAAAEAAAAEAAAAEARPYNGLRITAAREGFRRAGRAWSKQPIEIPLAGLSDADIAALKAESMLTVEEIVLP